MPGLLTQGNCGHYNYVLSENAVSGNLLRGRENRHDDHVLLGSDEKGIFGYKSSGRHMFSIQLQGFI